MDKYFKIAQLTCAAILALTTLLWIILQAKHFLAAPDGIIFLSAGIIMLIMSIAL
jgi:hypothetical protein